MPHPENRPISPARTPEEIERAAALLFRIAASGVLLRVRRDDANEANERIKKCWEVLRWVQGHSVEFGEALKEMEKLEKAHEAQQQGAAPPGLK